MTVLTQIKHLEVDTDSLINTLRERSKKREAKAAFYTNYFIAANSLLLKIFNDLWFLSKPKANNYLPRVKNIHNVIEKRFKAASSKYQIEDLMDNQIVEEYFRNVNLFEQILSCVIESRIFNKSLIQTFNLSDQNRISALYLYKDNWDGNGAFAVSKKSITNALNTFGALKNKKYEPAYIYPTAYGKVAMDYTNNIYRISIEVFARQIYNVRIIKYNSDDFKKTEFILSKQNIQHSDLILYFKKYYGC